MSLVVITPRLPPAIDGIGDYCRRLWQNWPVPETSAQIQDPSKGWKFLVLDGAEASRNSWPEMDIRQVEPSAPALVARLEEMAAKTALLQYVGYGYADDGAPIWLVDALSKWKAGDRHRRVVIMFHEIWAGGAPWKKAFWNRPFQRSCARQLVRLSSAVATNCRANADALGTLKTKTLIDIIPNGANFIASPTARKNWNHLLVFGKEQSRSVAIKEHKELIRKLVQDGLITRIVVAGQSAEPRFDSTKKLLDGLNLTAEIIPEFNFPYDDIPITVQTCGLSLMYTQSTYLPKSTAFQLASQLGQVALTRKEFDPGKPLVRNENYLDYCKDDYSDLTSNLANHDRLLEISVNSVNLSREYFSWSRIAPAWAQLIRHAPDSGNITSSIFLR